MPLQKRPQRKAPFGKETRVLKPLVKATSTKIAVKAADDNHRVEDVGLPWGASLGCRTYVRGIECIIRYKGPVFFADGEWIGVQFSLSQSWDDSNNGTVQGTKYFAAEKGCGLFIKEEELEGASPENLIIASDGMVPVGSVVSLLQAKRSSESIAVDADGLSGWPSPSPTVLVGNRFKQFPSENIQPQESITAKPSTDAVELKESTATMFITPTTVGCPLCCNGTLLLKQEQEQQQQSDSSIPLEQQLRKLQIMIEAANCSSQQNDINNSNTISSHQKATRLLLESENSNSPVWESPLDKIDHSAALRFPGKHKSLFNTTVNHIPDESIRPVLQDLISTSDVEGILYECKKILGDTTAPMKTVSEELQHLSNDVKNEIEDLLGDQLNDCLAVSAINNKNGDISECDLTSPLMSAINELLDDTTVTTSAVATTQKTASSLWKDFCLQESNMSQCPTTVQITRKLEERANHILSQHPPTLSEIISLTEYEPMNLLKFIKELPEVGYTTIHSGEAIKRLRFEILTLTQRRDQLLRDGLITEGEQQYDACIANTEHLMSLCVDQVHYVESEADTDIQFLENRLKECKSEIKESHERIKKMILKSIEDHSKWTTVTTNSLSLKEEKLHKVRREITEVINKFTTQQETISAEKTAAWMTLEQTLTTIADLAKRESYLQPKLLQKLSSLAEIDSNINSTSSSLVGIDKHKVTIQKKLSSYESLLRNISEQTTTSLDGCEGLIRERSARLFSKRMECHTENYNTFKSLYLLLGDYQQKKQLTLACVEKQLKDVSCELALHQDSLNPNAKQFAVKRDLLIQRCESLRSNTEQIESKMLSHTNTFGIVSEQHLKAAGRELIAAPEMLKSIKTSSDAKLIAFSNDKKEREVKTKEDKNQTD